MVIRVQILNETFCVSHKENNIVKSRNPIILFLVGWLFGFYGVSTFVGYLTPNSVYIYIPFTNEYLVGKIVYKKDFICLHN